ncbi:MAG: hypothetical protein EOP06_24315 [Proteobacteria bacterium]|nr:MAG: hypothetical protein EOP06_24315 [Pseudomonadota bacterium]
MKRPLKISLFAVTGIVAVALVFWMRSLASWRPVKLGALPWPYFPQHISKDERFVLTTDVISSTAYNFSTLDLVTGKSDKLPTIASVEDQSISRFGWADPFYWYLRSSNESEPLTLELQDPQSKLIKHTFRWKNREDADLVARIDNQTLRILSHYSFREFDLSSDKMTHSVNLEKPFNVFHSEVNEGDTPEEYAISSDGQTLYGYRGINGQIWDASTGKLLQHWKMPPSRTDNR